MERRDDWFDASVVMFMFTIVGVICGYGSYKITYYRFERMAIQHNAGQYNPTTGKFEWLDKSGEVQ
jgi:hypothetical protein